MGQWLGKQLRAFVLGDADAEGDPANLINRFATGTGNLVEETADSVLGFPSGIMGSGAAFLLELGRDIIFMVLRALELVLAMLNNVSKVIITIFEIMITDLLNLIETVLLYLFIFAAARPDVAIEVIRTFNNALVTTITSLANVVSSGTSAINSGANTLSQVGTAGIKGSADVTTTALKAGGAVADRAIGSGTQLAQSAGRGAQSAASGISNIMQRPSEQQHELKTIREQGAANNQVDLNKVGLERERMDRQDKARPDERQFELEKTGLEASSRERVEQARAQGGGDRKRLQLRSILGTPNEYSQLNTEQRAMRANNAYAEGFTDKEIDDYIKRNDKFVKGVETEYNEIISNSNVYNIYPPPQYTRDAMILAFKQSYSTDQNKVNRFERYVDWYLSGVFDQRLGNNTTRVNDKIELHDVLSSINEIVVNAYRVKKLRELKEGKSPDVQRMLQFDINSIKNSAGRFRDIQWSIFDEPFRWAHDDNQPPPPPPPPRQQPGQEQQLIGSVMDTN